MSDKCKYPIILIHGMFGWGDDEGINNYLPYWGANTCNIVEHYRKEGYEIHAGSVGPASSCWDRACELFARLRGGVVDYGKVHSDNANHKRYGRFYEKPLVEKWDSKNKIHLVGHSFGGNTARMLAYLLTYGSKDEVDADPENCSELFKGGHEDWLAGIVTICSPHNGTTTFLAANKFHLMAPMKFIVYNYMGLFGRSPAEGRIFDFHLEQYGMSDTPGKKDAIPLRRAKKVFRQANDNVEYDLGSEGARKLNEQMEISPNLYYFSYSYNAVTLDMMGRFHVPSNTDFPFLTFTSSLIMLYNKIFRGKGDYGFDDYANDGLVDLPSALFPKDEPHVSFDRNNINPGVWNVMKTRIGDHGTPIGLFSSADSTYELYDEMFSILGEVEGKLAPAKRAVRSRKKTEEKAVADEIAVNVETVESKKAKPAKKSAKAADKPAEKKTAAKSAEKPAEKKTTAGKSKTAAKAADKPAEKKTSAKAADKPAEKKTVSGKTKTSAKAAEKPAAGKTAAKTGTKKTGAAKSGSKGAGKAE